MTVLEGIQATKIVAIVRMEHYAQAREIVRALLAGGISLIEFTLAGKKRAGRIYSLILPARLS